jgi:succinyl-CoA synthetase alpha subunit
LIAGRTIPPGRAIGHAGAFIIGSKGTHQSKVTALRDAGVRVAETVEQIPELLIS